MKSWSVVDKPDWLKADESRFSLTLSVNSKNYPSSEQSGVVVLKAFLTDGSTLTRTINVRIVPVIDDYGDWTKSTWSFSGKMQYVYKQSGVVFKEEKVSVKLKFEPTDNNKVIVYNGQFTSTCSIDAQGRIVGTMPYSSFDMTITRTGEKTAICELKSQFWIIDADKQEYIIRGTLDGKKK